MSTEEVIFTYKPGSSGSVVVRVEATYDSDEYEETVNGLDQDEDCHCLNESQISRSRLNCISLDS